jgi:hypothetical protein
MSEKEKDRPPCFNAYEAMVRQAEKEKREKTQNSNKDNSITKSSK